MKVQIIHNAKNATGTAVIIDVFRAFTVEPYLINNGAKKFNSCRRYTNSI